MLFAQSSAPHIPLSSSPWTSTPAHPSPPGKLLDPAQPVSWHREPGLVNFGIWKPSHLPPSECSTALSTPRNLPMSPFLSPSLRESPFLLTVSRFCAFPTQSGRQRLHLQLPGSEANKGNPAGPALRFPQNSSASRSALPAVAPRLFRISVGNYSELVERGQVARGCRREEGGGRDRFFKVLPSELQGLERSLRFETPAPSESATRTAR